MTREEVALVKAISREIAREEITLALSTFVPKLPAHDHEEIIPKDHKKRAQHR